MKSTKKNRLTNGNPEVNGKNSLACVIVTYHPDIQILRRQLEKLPPSAAVVLVDNASAAYLVEAVCHLAAGRKRTHFIANDRNLGLAAAINQGVRQVKVNWPETRFVLLLDQDSEPLPGSIELLVQKTIDLKKECPSVGCVGPNLLDPVTGLSHGFHQTTHWRWIRKHPSKNSTQLIPCANLNGSGTLVPLDLFLELGGLDESLFIDHVDTEWSFRVTAAGYVLFGIPGAHFIHRMGENSRRVWLLGWRIWPMRTPQRHYYLFRNVVILMRRDYVPRVWKFWAGVKLMLTAVVHGLIDNQRVSQFYHMLKGLRDGLRIRSKAEKLN